MANLSELPYVNGTPSFTQLRVEWVHNGVLLTGATTQFGDDGVANRVGRQLLKNIETLEGNIVSVNDEVISLGTELEKIKEDLGEAGTTSIIESVNKNTGDLVTTNLRIDANVQRIDTIDNDLAIIKPTLGYATISAPISESVNRLKAEVGNRNDQDLDGNPSPGTEATGLIRRTNDINTQVVVNRNDITELKQTLDAANIPALIADADQFRTELGPTPAIGTPTVYSRFSNVEIESTRLNSEIVSIKDSLGPDPLGPIVSSQTTAISELDSSVDAINTSVAALRTDVDLNTNKITNINSAIAEIQTTVGDQNSGLVKSNSELRSTVGIDSVTPTSVIGRLNTLENSSTAHGSSLQDIEVILGSSTTGLQGDVAANKTAINGNSGATDPVEKVGLMTATKELNQAVSITNGVVNTLALRYPYALKKLSVLSDNLTKLDATKISSYLGTDALKSVKGTAGVASISQNVDFSSAIAAEVIHIDVSTFDYVNSTPIADFEADLRALLDLVITPTSTSRVLLSTGFKSTQVAGAVYPAANTAGHRMSDYVDVVKIVADDFSLPVLDTCDESGIIEKNNAAFVNATGLNIKGQERLNISIAGFIGTK